MATLLATAAWPACAESLMDIVKLAQDSDPQFQAAKFQNQADAEATVQAWARFIPHLHAGTNMQQVNQNILSSDNAVYAVGSTSYPTYGYDVTLEQSLFNYSNWANLKAAQAQVRQSNAQFEAAKQDLLLRAVERYFTVLAAIETADAAHAESRALREHFDLVQSRQRGGTARTAELMDAQARHLQSQAKQTQADAAVRDAIAGLRQITGATPGSLNGLSEQLQIKPLDPDDPQHWIELARKNNPRIKAAIEASERGHQQVEIERSGWYPNASLELFQNRHRTQGSLFGGGSDVQETGAMVKLNVPIYEGGETSSKIREADSLYGKARAEEDKTGRDVVRETEAAVDGIRTAASQVSALGASLRAQQQVVEQVNQAFASGAASNIDVLDAQRDLFLARAEYVRARYDYALDTLKLRHAVGLLDIADLDQINRLLAAKPVNVDDYAFGRTRASALPAPEGVRAAQPAATAPARSEAAPEAPSPAPKKKQAAIPAVAEPHAVAAVAPATPMAAVAAAPAVGAAPAVSTAHAVAAVAPAAPAVAQQAAVVPALPAVKRNTLIRTADAGPEAQ